MRRPKAAELVWMRLAVFAVAASLVGGAAGCFSVQPFEDDAKDRGPLGSFQISSAVLGQRALSPRTCLAGDRDRFLGADFVDARLRIVIRLAIDPIEGPAIRVFERAAEFDKTVVFRRSECRTFHFSEESTGWRINDVQDYRVSLELDCTNRSGDSIAGKASATHCH